MIGPFDEKSSRCGSECDYRAFEHVWSVKRLTRAENSGQWHYINTKVLVCRYRQGRYLVYVGMDAVFGEYDYAPSIHTPYSAKNVWMSDRVGFMLIAPSTHAPYSTKKAQVVTACRFVPHGASSGAPGVLASWQLGQAVPQVNRTAQNTFLFSLVFLALFSLLFGGVQLAILLSWFGSVGCSIGFVVCLSVTELVVEI